MSSIVRAFDWLLVDRMFRKNERGETIFRPFGVFGSRFVAPESRLADLRHASRRLWIITLVLIVSTVVLGRRISIPDNKPVEWLAVGTLWALLIGLVHILQSRLAANLERERAAPPPRTREPRG